MECRTPEPAPARPPRRAIAALALACAALCLWPASLRAELYRWTDENGVHFTDDLSQVPPEHRVQAEREARRAPRAPQNWNEVDTPDRPLPQAQQAPASAAGSGRTHVIRTRPGSREIRLTAVLNGSVQANFIADTGAMLNTIPRSALAGLDVDLRNAPTVTFQGVGGRSMEAPLVMLRSVQIGDLVVENVEMAVLDTLPSGLLGLPFFNNFNFSYDPAAGKLTLEKIDVDQIEGLYGGYDEATWREKFSGLRKRLEALDRMAEETPEGRRGLRVRIEEERARIQAQLDTLEMQATRVGVPRGWRR